MLVQNPSKIFKSDFAIWKQENGCQIREIITEKEHLNLRKVTEIVFDENGKYHFQSKENCNLIILVLYGEILIENIKKQISADQIFTLKSTETKILTLNNNFESEKADVLIIELKAEESDNFTRIKNLNIIYRNSFIPIVENFDYPNFIGLYDGRKEDTYTLNQYGKTIFGMVLNGAFEFQNRLMENRDAILLNEIETLEFEALSENALILFLKV